MKKLMKNKKGFTLMEMLIVIAIIVILVAISVPTFTGQLNKAKEAADAANYRAAKAQAIMEYMVNESDIDGLVYDLNSGKFVAAEGVEAYGEASGNTENVIYAEVSEDGEVSVKWATAKKNGTAENP